MATAQAAQAAGDADSILYDVRGNVAFVTLNRPDKLNSLNETMHKVLREALNKASADKNIRALILTGAGRGFCAGQDLSDRVAAAGEVDLSQTIAAYYNPLILQIRALPFPAIAAVNGVAAGAGANIAFAADIVIAGKSAKFIQSFSRIGLIPDSGGTWVLPRLLGRGKAFAIAALSESISAEDAETFGLIYKAVDDGALIDAAGELAAKLASLPTAALVKLRELFDAAEKNDLAVQLELERKTQGALGASKDYAEGVAAFFEKRASKFSAR